MLLPTKVDLWYAEAVTRVYQPWITGRGATVVGERQRTEVAALILQARLAASLPPLPGTAGGATARARWPVRAPAGRWIPVAA